jgi:hypothetical protein
VHVFGLTDLEDVVARECAVGAVLELARRQIKATRAMITLCDATEIALVAPGARQTPRSIRLGAHMPKRNLLATQPDVKSSARALARGMERA